MLLIAAAVLVPFAALVWWGLAALQHEPQPVTPPAPPVAAPVQAPAPAVPAPPRAAPPPVVAPTAPADEPEPAPAAGPDRPPMAEEAARAAVVEQLKPVVQTCFGDADPRAKRPLRVSALFQTRPDGSVVNVRLKMKSADPYLLACVQDALEGAHLDPAQGLPSGEMRYTFGVKEAGSQ